jgi:putative flippase GtrA
MSPLLRESSIYALGAAAAFAVDFALLWLFVDQFGVHYLPAATLSFLAGTAVVYLVSVHHAFRYRRVEDRRLEFGYFATIGAAGVVLNLVLIYLLVERLTLHYLAAKVGAAGVSFVANFAVRRWCLFTRRIPADRNSISTTESGR